jgi:poly-gamma-glutamate capsule biosynthesis protein CapA/YwtB (metallophosphatase superfamily)
LEPRVATSGNLRQIDRPPELRQQAKSGRSLTVLLAGDALIVGTYAIEDDARRSFVELVRASDVAFTNLEVLLNEFRGPPAPGIGIHLSATPRSGRELIAAGFNLFSVANNHALDYGVEGLRRHLDALRGLGTPFAGAGETATEATRPAYVETANGRVALVACASSLGAGWPAAEPGPGVEGRPGVNALRFDTRYIVEPEAFERVRRVADALGFARVERHNVEMGYVVPLSDPERQIRLLDGVVERGLENRVTTAPVRVDLDRILASVHKAANQSDVVIVSLHTQEWLENDEQPAEFARTFARTCADAGADVVAMSGPHVLRGIELYGSTPIFYSLGNLWFEYELVERLPPDSLEPYGLSADATPADFSDHAMLGFQRDARFWETVVARCVFTGGELCELTLHPVALGFGRPRGQRGQPSLASDAEATGILERIRALSHPHGTTVDANNAIGRVALTGP